jgi:micrococcal nuclease
LKFEKMKSFQKALFWIFIFVATIFCCRLYFSAENKSSEENFSRVAVQTKILSTTLHAGYAPALQIATTTASVPVSRVIDGDTIVVLLGGQEETVRLLGMDTPETVDPRKSVQCFGPEASAETKSLLDGRDVTLQSDPTQSDRDKYGRLLRYVFRDDGLFVDEFLVQQGFAREYTYFNSAYEYQTKFRADQAAAQLAGLGLWATSTCDGKI